MLDIACNTLGRYRSNCSFDGHAVIPVTIPCDQTNLIYNDHGKMQSFIDASVCELNHNKEMKPLQKSFQFFPKHTVRRKNEFIQSKKNNNYFDKSMFFILSDVSEVFLQSIFKL